MKALLVGLGSAGFSWYKRLRNRGMIGAVVETNIENKSKLGTDEVPFFSTLEEAWQHGPYDFVVNVTPPMVHTRINEAAFERKLPVLCEKPISFDYQESIDIVRRSVSEGIPFMIAENYRRFPYVRRLKQLLDQGVIGQISTIDIQFSRYHHVQRNYTVSLLDDIGIHHLDMVRYLTGAECSRIHAWLYNPVAGWEEEGAIIAANVLLELEDGVRVSYHGSIAARSKPTAWCGNWRIEGTEGAIELIDQKLVLTRSDCTEQFDDWSGVDRSDTLDEFLASLTEQREAETSGRDYLKTQALVHYAHQSNASGRTVQVVLPEVE